MTDWQQKILHHEIHISEKLQKTYRPSRYKTQRDRRYTTGFGCVIKKTAILYRQN